MQVLTLGVCGLLGRISSRLTYANVMATAAVFIALGGGAHAAFRLPANSVGTSQLKRHAVTRSKLDPGLLSALTGQRGKAGAPGAPGASGSKGDPGAPGRDGAAVVALDHQDVLFEPDAAVARTATATVSGVCGSGSFPLQVTVNSLKFDIVRTRPDCSREAGEPKNRDARSRVTTAQARTVLRSRGRCSSSTPTAPRHRDPRPARGGCRARRSPGSVVM